MRVCRVGPDGKLYVASASRHNVPPESKAAHIQSMGHGRDHPHEPGRVRDREVFARGIRNSVGLDFKPADGVLWFTDNQVDMMGDDIPPEELNRAPRPG